MKKDKNIIKGDRFVELKTVKEREFYAVVEKKVKVPVKGEPNTFTNETKSFVITAVGTRIQAKNELNQEAKRLGAKLVHFGGFK